MFYFGSESPGFTVKGGRVNSVRLYPDIRYRDAFHCADRNVAKKHGERCLCWTHYVLDLERHPAAGIRLLYAGTEITLLPGKGSVLFDRSGSRYRSRSNLFHPGKNSEPRIHLHPGDAISHGNNGVPQCAGRAASRIAAQILINQALLRTVNKIYSIKFLIK